MYFGLIKCSIRYKFLSPTLILHSFLFTVSSCNLVGYLQLQYLITKVLTYRSIILIIIRNNNSSSSIYHGNRLLHHIHVFNNQDNDFIRTHIESL